MNKLEEMKNSCKVFAADLKTGDIEWSKDVHHENGFITKWNDNKIRFYIIHEIGTEGQPCYFKLESFFYRGYVLQSTTAKEAAHEALQLVKKEAQKLVDSLDVEHKVFTIAELQEKVTKYKNNTLFIHNKNNEIKSSRAYGWNEDSIAMKNYKMEVEIWEAENKEIKQYLLSMNCNIEF